MHRSTDHRRRHDLHASTGAYGTWVEVQSTPGTVRLLKMAGMEPWLNVGRVAAVASSAALGRVREPAPGPSEHNNASSTRVQYYSSRVTVGRSGPPRWPPRRPHTATVCLASSGGQRRGLAALRGGVGVGAGAETQGLGAGVGHDVALVGGGVPAPEWREGGPRAGRAAEGAARGRISWTAARRRDGKARPAPEGVAAVQKGRDGDHEARRDRTQGLGTWWFSRGGSSSRPAARRASHCAGTACPRPDRGPRPAPAAGAAPRRRGRRRRRRRRRSSNRCGASSSRSPTGSKGRTRGSCSPTTTGIIAGSTCSLSRFSRLKLSSGGRAEKKLLHRLDWGEFQNAVRKGGHMNHAMLSDADLRKLFSAVDSDGSGDVSIDEL